MHARVNHVAGNGAAERSSDPADIAESRLREAVKLQRAGEFDQAQALCEQLLDQYPDYVGALYTLGMIHAMRGDPGQALPYFVRAAMHNPFDFRVMTNLASVYMALGADEMASLTLERVVAQKPDVAEIHYNLGQIYVERREYARAAKCFERVLELQPSHGSAAKSLGDCHEHLGRLADAAAAYRRAFELEPSAYKILAPLSNLPASLVDMDLLAEASRIERTLADPSGDAAITLGFVRARAFDKLGRYREAWSELVAVNNRIYAEARTALAAERETRERQLHSAQSFRVIPQSAMSAGGDVPLSLFILGPSRSGKTTLERLLATIDGVVCGHENRIIADMVRRTHQVAGRLSNPELEALPQRLYPQFAELYARDLRERAADCRVFTNTLPGLISKVGPAIAALPNSKVVFVKRDLEDVAIRIYFRRYASRNFHAYNMNTIMEFLSWYYRMMDLWSEKFPQQVMTVWYDRMIEDPAAILAQVAGFCGLSTGDGSLPPLGDDRGCARPYREWLHAMIGHDMSNISPAGFAGTSGRVM